MFKNTGHGYEYDIPTEIEPLCVEPVIEPEPQKSITEPAVKETVKQPVETTKLNFWQRQIKNTNFKRAIINGTVLGLLLTGCYYGAQTITENSREMAMNYAADTIFLDLQATRDAHNITSDDIEADFKERIGFTTFKYNVVKMDDCVSVSVNDPIFGGDTRRAFGTDCFYEFTPEHQRILDGIVIESTQDEEEE